MLWTALIVILVLWFLGFVSGFGGSAIHFLLLVAVAVLVVNIITGRRVSL